MNDRKHQAHELLKAMGCQTGPRGGYYFTTPSGHKIYVKNASDCNKMAQKFLSKEQVTDQETKSVLQSAIVSVNEVIANPKEFVSGLMEFIKLSGGGKVNAQTIMEQPGWSGSQKQAQKLARKINIKKFTDKIAKKTSHLLHTEKRGHAAGVKAFLGTFSSVIGKAAVKAGEKIGSSALVEFGKKEIENSQLKTMSPAETAMGAGYVGTYSWAYLAPAVHYATYAKMAASAAVGTSLVASVAGSAIALVISLKVWNAAIKPMSRVLASSLGKQEVSTLQNDIAQGYVGLDELKPEHRQEMARHILLKSQGEASPEEMKMMDGVFEAAMPEILSEIFTELETKGFSETEKAMIHYVLESSAA